MPPFAAPSPAPCVPMVRPVDRVLKVEGGEPAEALHMTVPMVRPVDRVLKDEVTLGSEVRTLRSHGQTRG